MSGITKEHLTESLTRELGISKRESRKTVNAMIKTISEMAMAGEPVRVPNLGTFYQRYKQGRPGRNPQTGIPAPIGARTVVTCKFSELFKKAVLDGSE